LTWYHTSTLLLPPLGTQLEAWRKYNNVTTRDGTPVRLSSSSSHFCSIKYEISPIDAEVYLTGLVSGEKHISLSQVLIPRVTNNTNLYGTVTDLKTNTPDKKSRPIWGVMILFDVLSYLSVGDLRVIVIPLRLAGPVWNMVVRSGLWRYRTLRTRGASARLSCPYCGWWWIKLSPLRGASLRLGVV